MAKQDDRKYNVGPPSFQPLKRTPTQKAHFFLDGKLYKTMRQDRSNDILMAWCYHDERMVQFVLSDVKRKMKNAYDTKEVTVLLNRTRPQLTRYIMEGVINEPYRIFSYGKNLYGHPFTKMKWSEDDILALHDYLLTLGSGRPRKDGIMYAATRLPSRRELLAMLRNQPTFYMRTADGDFVPVWSAYDEV